MKVFKLFMKMIKANSAMLILSVVLFVFFTGIMMGQENQTVRSVDKINVLVRDEDQSEYSSILASYLSDIANAKTESEYGDDLRDAIFYKEVDYIVVIPSGFGNDIKTSQVSLDVTDVSHSMNSMVFTQKMESYLTILHSNLDLNPEIETQELKLETGQLAQQQVEANIVSTTDTSSLMYPHQFGNAIYPILLTSLSVIVAVVRSVFSDKSRYRLYCAPLKTSELLVGTALGGVVLMSAFFLLQLGILRAFGYAIFDPINRLYVLNLYLCTITTTLLALAIGILVSSKSRNVGTIIGNLVSLSSCFLTGVFIPQDVLPTYVTSVSRLLPTYWTINANTLIRSSQGAFTGEIGQVFIIQVLYMVSFLIICALLFRTYNKIEG